MTSLEFLDLLLVLSPCFLYHTYFSQFFGQYPILGVMSHIDLGNSAINFQILLRSPLLSFPFQDVHDVLLGHFAVTHTSLRRHSFTFII